DPASWNALLAGYANNGHLSLAKSCFGHMPQRDLVSWNSLLAVYARNGLDNLDLFRAMLIEGIPPDESSFTSVLSGHSGDLQLSWSHFTSMVSNFRLAPSKQQYGCILAVLARCGYFQQAEELIRSMPFLADSRDWLSVLGACRQDHSASANFRAAGQAWRIDPHDSAPYVLLA
ncbi:hypothetical protein SELMODRAFT_72269, partial [Selaginella moellendorffii]